MISRNRSCSPLGVVRPTPVVALVLAGLFGGSSSALAQRATGLLSTGDRLVWTAATPAAREAAPLDPTEAPWWIGPDPSTKELRAIGDLLAQLPVERVQRALGTPRALRFAEAGVGAAVVSYACTRSETSAHVLWAGIQAIRFAGGDALRPGGFQFEPSVGDGFALFVRRRL
jgi:hypothetical protein